MLVTNYSRQDCMVTISKQANSGPGTTACQIDPPVISCSTDAAPNAECIYCVGDVIRLHCDPVPGATYEWTGPNG